MGGSPATGDPRVVSLAMLAGGAWTQCSGAMWRPRLIITAAHCVTPSGSSGLVDRVAVFAPGSSATIYRDIGPQGPASAQVVSILRQADYVNATNRVSPNDIAVLVLDRDLAPAGFQRLATQPELGRWIQQSAPVTHTGYGLTGPGQRTTIPNSAQLPLASASSSAAGVRFSTAQTNQVATCPGDSGSPAYRPTTAGDILIGVIAGSSAPCTADSSSPPGAIPGMASNVGFVALGYPDLLDAATAAAGYASVPGAPASVGAGWLPGSPGAVVVAWQAPQRNASAVVGVEVWDGDVLVCAATAASSCVVTGATPGPHEYVARSVNAQAEGDARAIAQPLEVPVASSAPLSSLRSAPAGSGPWIVGQPIVAFAGCLLRPPASSRLQVERSAARRTAAKGDVRRDAQLCSTAKRPLALTYSFTLRPRDLSGVDASGRGTVRVRSVVDGRERSVTREAFASVDAWAAALSVR